jgi:hypothetical protein
LNGIESIEKECFSSVLGFKASFFTYFHFQTTERRDCNAMQMHKKEYENVFAPAFFNTAEYSKVPRK